MLVAECGALPAAYLAFLRVSNGAECGPNDAPGDSLRILPAGEVVRFNIGYKIARYLPELLCFASDGGDYAFAFHRVGAVDEWPVVRIPLGALLPSEVMSVSKSFHSWQEAEYRYSVS